MDAPAVRTTCPYCGVGCGVVAQRFGSVTQVEGDPAHPANAGRLCSKGAQLAATVDAPGRLEAPRLHGDEVGWDTALDAVATGFTRIIEEHGPDAVAFYVSGQLLTEDYYVANKLMKGAIGSANIDTNSRLCMASAVVGHKRAFGADLVPCGYDDVCSAELVVLVGSNLAWCHPVLYQRLQAARHNGGGPTLIVIDPRRTATAAEADLHLPIRPGMDTVLFGGLLNWLHDNDATDAAFIQDATENYAQARLAAREQHSVADVAARCGLNYADVISFYERFANTHKTVTVFSQGVNQSSVGSDKVNAIINVHLATGRIGKPGTGPFSITGQPNAMGGREVGGMASQLAAHMDFEPDSVDRVRRFWGFERIATRRGLQAVPLFDAIAAGKVKAVWIMGTNPAVSMPRATDVRRALERCELVVVSDCVAQTDTTRYADVVLPACGWGEKDGTVTNSERCISRQRAFRPAIGEARADWRIMCDVAARMGFAQQFNYRNSADIFREHAALSAFENDGRRDFDIGALADIDNDQYERLNPVYWPCPKNGPPTVRPVDILKGHSFYTDNRKARFVAVRSSGTAASTDDRYPLLLLSGRLRDQWHTMTRTANAPRLNRHTAEPLLSLHPLDARQFGVTNDQVVSVQSRSGTVQLRARITRTMQPGQGFAPMHWSDVFATSAAVGTMMRGECDPLSGQPELKAEPVAVRPASIERHALVLTRPGVCDPLPVDIAPYCVRSRFEHCEVYFLGFGPGSEDRFDQLTAVMPDVHEMLTYNNDTSRTTQAGVSDDAVQYLVVVGAEPCNADAGWLADLFAHATVTAESKQALLRGSPAHADLEAGCSDTVCACFGTRRGAVVAASSTLGLATPEAIGAALDAGTNCGSCLPEIREILDEV